MRRERFPLSFQRLVKMESDISIWKKFTAFGYAWMTFLGISKTQSLITKCLIIKQKESDRVRIVSVFLKKTQEAADLLEVVIIRLGRGNSERGVIDFLTGVFSGNQEIVFSYLPDDITKEEREEVGNMLSLVDYAEKRGEKSGEKRGEKRGKRIGEKRGQKIAESRMQELLQKLIADNRTEDLVKISKDKEHLKKMYKEYGIGEDE